MNDEAMKTALMNTEHIKNFLVHSEHTGRHIVKSIRTGKTYFVESIDAGNKVKWGDLNPATGKVEGQYGCKYKGSIRSDESLITEENGFHNIIELLPGQSPCSHIEAIDAQYPNKE